MKKCNKCLEEKELFTFDKVSKNACRNTCRKCRNAINRSNYFLKEGSVEKMREYQREYQKKHRENNEYYQIYCKAISNIRYRIKNDIELRNYIELKFDSNMNWDNYGIYWELDHIISATKMAKLGYTIDEINKLSNLRPLEIKENRSRYKENVNEPLI
jgi:hypothetical protein